MTYTFTVHTLFCIYVVDTNNQQAIDNSNRKGFYLNQLRTIARKTASQIASEELVQRIMLFSCFISCQNKEH